jgi:hypothetical protein
MNRAEHLLETAQAIARLRSHNEHVTLDFGSSIPISRDQLPGDDRVKLYRVERPNGKWWLTHAYNLAFALAERAYILKLDADILPSQDFMDKVCEQQARTNAHLLCNRLTLQDWGLPSSLFTTNGLFLCKRSSLVELGGFNPYIQGWGWDELDLYSRFFLSGFPVARLPQDGLSLIEHEDNLREPPVRRTLSRSIPLPPSKLEEVTPTRRKQAQNAKNRQIAIAYVKSGLKWPSLDE